MINHEDDDLLKFEAEGTTLPDATQQGYAEHDGARIWFSTYGHGSPVIMLHGGLGHSGNWASQVEPLVSNGHQVILIDSRGHGRSTRDERPYSYELMAADVLAVMDKLAIGQSYFIGWSDGATIALVLASQHPERVVGVFYFACNMDASGTKPFEETPLINRCFSRHMKDYARLSTTPDGFQDFVDAVSEMMKTQPNYTAEDLAKIAVPVTVAIGENDEFIKLEHAQYLAQTIPGAKLVILPDVSHFAPLQRPDLFNTALKSDIGERTQ